MSATLPEIHSGEQGAAWALRSIAASLEAQAADLEGAPAGKNENRAGSGAGRVVWQKATRHRKLWKANE